MALAGANRDIRFDLQRVAGYRNFCNKLWNAARFVTLMVPTAVPADTAPAALSIADRWIRSRFGRRLAEVQTALGNYRFDYAATALYEFTWDEFCAWYLELTKPLLQSESTSDADKYGTRWIGTSAPNIGFHATPADYSVGHAASHGCMRMHRTDVERMYDLVTVGETVEIKA